MSKWLLLAHKVLQEQRRRNSSSIRTSQIRNIRNLALQQLIVLFCQGHSPGLISRNLRNILETLGEIIVIGPNSANLLSERNHAGTGERGEFDDGFASEFLVGVDESVGEGEASFGIGVEDLDGFAVGGGEDIGGDDGAATDHVLARSDNEMSFHSLGLHVTHCTSRTEYCRSTTAVEFHQFHHRCLDVVSTGVKEESFPNDTNLFLDVTFAGLVSQMNKLWLRLASPSHTQIRTHTPLLAILFIQNGARDTSSALLGNSLCRIGETHGVQHIVGSVDNVFGERDSLGDLFSGRDGCRQIVRGCRATFHE
mmetsp:Transcript_22419/g.45113  ORF Transcript_22419/g.45113 Transcript_22419/m.45113 type:complete len:310 (-) Transcript_22419:963-1892(-)